MPSILYLLSLTNIQSMRAFMFPRDIALFIRSARTDSRLGRLRKELDAGSALEAIYAADPDPWCSASPQYKYQSRKYEVLVSLLPKRPYRRALDLGCGTGILSGVLVEIADQVLGVDISPSAVALARVRHADCANLTFAAHDLLTLPASFDGAFDLVVVADVLYYLSPLDDALLQSLSARIARLLSPHGICLLANHYVLRFDPDSRRSRRIHAAFRAATGLVLRESYRRPFYLVDLFEPVTPA